MNWCNIKHKWIYKNEDIVISSPYIFFNGVSGLEVTIPTQVRLCNRCHKKQRSRGIDWVDWELSLEEERDIKLKELGI